MMKMERVLVLTLVVDRLNYSTIQAHPHRKALAAGLAHPAKMCLASRRGFLTSSNLPVAIQARKPVKAYRQNYLANLSLPVYQRKDPNSTSIPYPLSVWQEAVPW